VVLDDLTPYGFDDGSSKPAKRRLPRKRGP
jgi:hypothetical protein